MTLDGSPPSSLAPIAARVAARIEALLDGERRRWSQVDADLVEPIDQLGRLVAGGKRLRPAFCHWAHVGAGGDPADRALDDVVAALELAQVSALVHDDVIDAADQRRGAATVHRLFEDLHSKQAWPGESRRFGEGVAILVGDLAASYVYALVAGCPAPVTQVLANLRLEVDQGQYLDLLASARGATSDQARRIARYKSAKYTVERPLHLGAALAGRLDQLEAPLSAVGLPLGQAFQMRDDLLGTFGDPAVTGKPVGDDLRQGKPTLLTALALERAAGPDAALLAEGLGRRDLSDSDVVRLRDVLQATGARQEVEAELDALLAQALTAIEEAPILAEARVELTALAVFATHRDR